MRYIILIGLLHTLLGAVELNKSYFDQEDLGTFYAQKESELTSKRHQTSQPDIIEQRLLIVKKIRSLLKEKFALSTVEVPKRESKPQLFINLLKTYMQTFSAYKKHQEEYTIFLQRKKITVTNIQEATEENETLQLQYAYYFLRVNQLFLQVNRYKEHIDIMRKVLIGPIGHYKIDENGLMKKVQSLEKTIEERQIEIERYMVRSDGEMVVGYEESKYYPRITALKNEVKETEEKLFEEKLVMLLFYLQQEESKAVYKTLKSITKLQQVSTELAWLNIRQLEGIVNDKLGVTSAALGNTISTVVLSWEMLSEWFQKPLWEVNNTQYSLITIIQVILFITISMILANLYRKRILLIKNRWPKTSQQSIKFLSNFGFYFIVVIIFIIALDMLGLDLSSVSLIAGALSIGIGFGLQTIVSNFIAGIILIFERSIRIGDRIEISDTLKGRVTDIRIRSTTIQTFDNIDVIVPNSAFMQNNVINWTLEDKRRRILIPFGVAYGTDIDKVRDVILTALKESALVYVKGDKEKEPSVRMTMLNSSSVDCELVVWIDYATVDKMSFHHDFLEFIYRTLHEHHIAIPFPQLDVHMKNDYEGGDNNIL
jgi:small-conductance mechanosensitive channel